MKKVNKEKVADRKLKHLCKLLDERLSAEYLYMQLESGNWDAKPEFILSLGLAIRELNLAIEDFYNSK